MPVLGGLDRPVLFGGQGNHGRAHQHPPQRTSPAGATSPTPRPQTAQRLNAVRKLVSSTGRGCEHVLVTDPNSMVGRTSRSLAWVGGGDETKCTVEMTRIRHALRDRATLRIAVTPHSARACPKTCAVLTGPSQHSGLAKLHSWPLSGKEEQACLIPMSVVDRYVCVLLEGGSGHHHRIARLELTLEEHSVPPAETSAREEPSASLAHSDAGPRASPIPFDEEACDAAPPKTAQSPQCAWAVRPNTRSYPPASVKPPDFYGMDEEEVGPRDPHSAVQAEHHHHHQQQQQQQPPSWQGAAGAAHGRSSSNASFASNPQFFSPGGGWVERDSMESHGGRSSVGGGSPSGHGAPVPPSPSDTGAPQAAAAAGAFGHHSRLSNLSHLEGSTVVVDINASEIFGTGGPLEGLSPQYAPGGYAGGQQQQHPLVGGSSDHGEAVHPDDDPHDSSLHASHLHSGDVDRSDAYSSVHGAAVPSEGGGGAAHPFGARMLAEGGGAPQAQLSYPGAGGVEGVQQQQHQSSSGSHRFHGGMEHSREQPSRCSSQACDTEEEEAAGGGEGAVEEAAPGGVASYPWGYQQQQEQEQMQQVAEHRLQRGGEAWVGASLSASRCNRAAVPQLIPVARGSQAQQQQDHASQPQQPQQQQQQQQGDHPLPPAPAPTPATFFADASERAPSAPLSTGSCAPQLYVKEVSVFQMKAADQAAPLHRAARIAPADETVVIEVAGSRGLDASVAGDAHHAASAAASGGGGGGGSRTPAAHSRSGSGMSRSMLDTSITPFTIRSSRCGIDVTPPAQRSPKRGRGNRESPPPPQPSAGRVLRDIPAASPTTWPQQLQQQEGTPQSTSSSASARSSAPRSGGSCGSTLPRPSRAPPSVPSPSPAPSAQTQAPSRGKCRGSTSRGKSTLPPRTPSDALGCPVVGTPSLPGVPYHGGGGVGVGGVGGHTPPSLAADPAVSDRMYALLQSVPNMGPADRLFNTAMRTLISSNIGDVGVGVGGAAAPGAAPGGEGKIPPPPSTPAEQYQRMSELVSSADKKTVARSPLRPILVSYNM